MTDRRRSSVIGWALLGTALASASLFACVDGGGESVTSTSERATLDSSDAESIAQVLECSNVEMLNEMIGPLRSAAAQSGVSCQLGGSIIHVFQRHEPIPTNPSAGTIESIETILRAGIEDPACTSFVAIGDGWFVIAASEALLKSVTEVLGGVVVPVLPVAPNVSYPGAPGCA